MSGPQSVKRVFGILVFRRQRQKKKKKQTKKKTRKKKERGTGFPLGLIASAAASLAGKIVKSLFKKKIRRKKKNVLIMREKILLW